MKISTYILLTIASPLLLMSCEHDVTSETTVYPDGRVDKKFVFERGDTVRNLLGISRSKDWNKQVRLADNSANKMKDVRYVATYKKKFSSVDEANQELASPNDTLLRITSTFEKRFRWFYTYITYSETIHALNWLRLKPDNFLVAEDYAFIDRLPAEGKPISKADEFFLGELNKRLYDSYGMRAVFEEYMDIGEMLLNDHGVEQRWIDTLKAHTDELFVKMKNEQTDMKDFVKMVDSLGIPLDTASAGPDFRLRNRLLERKLSFISTSSEGKYKYIVHFPWTLGNSNADSTAGSTAYWAPPSIKFLVKDYTMFAESRKPNYLVWILSAGIVLGTLYLVSRARKIV